MLPGNRRLYFHAFVFLALAPVAGFFIMAPVPNPRAVLSLHVGTWLMVAASAAAFPYLAYGPAGRRWTERGLLLGFWMGFALSLVQVIGNTPTMFAGGDPTPPAWASACVKALQMGITVTLVPALFSMAIGLGKKLNAGSA